MRRKIKDGSHRSKLNELGLIFTINLEETLPQYIIFFYVSLLSKYIIESFAIIFLGHSDSVSLDSLSSTQSHWQTWFSNCETM